MNRLLLLLAALLLTVQAIAEEAAPLRLLVITGNHGFHPSFYSLFEGHDDIVWDKKTQAGDPCRAYSEDFAAGYDAVLLYDFEMNITPEQQKAFEAAFGDGRGLIVLHHALCSHPAWPGFRQITGGQFLFEARDGLPKSTYKGDVSLTYEVADPDHPTTRGVESFTVIEEPYKHVFRPKDAVPLLKADHAESNSIVAWATQYKTSRVVAIEPGHGPQIFENAQYRKFLAQSIRWVAGRAPKEGE